ncbi:flavin-binding monooxygenase [Mangrovihabitans endophyticus]|uniref:Flavin-binding monooxygenase n=1 Tax=Mangrovihabitans endophyticus TaxID=1751298 RepID=A0A8J3BXZ5_9ACTN|nr:flavin-binding monooxygenase [Mangrovihabitans endophyticus]
MIGSGVSGIAAVREIGAEVPGAHVTWLSADTEAGGLWNASSTCARVYDSLFLNTSRRQSTFHGTRIPVDPWIEFVHHSIYATYLAEVAADCRGVDRRWGHRVTSVSRHADGGWRVAWRDADGHADAACFAAVIDATGRNAEPRWPGVAVDPEPSYEYRHSAAYRNAAPYRGRNVLVVGNGASAVDIACELVGVASGVTVSVRTPKWHLPKMMFGRPVDRSAEGLLGRFPGARRLTAAVAEFVVRKVLGPYPTYGLGVPPSPLAASTPVLNDHFLGDLSHGRIAVRGPVVELGRTAVRFADGEAAFDAVIAATGFRERAVHLPGDVQELLGTGGLGLALEAPGRPALFLMNRFRCGDAAVRCAEVQAAAIGRALRRGQALRPGPLPRPVAPGARITAGVLRGAYAAYQ